MYKLSRYNHFQSGHDDSHIAYNARSGAVAVLTEENYAAVRVLAGKLSNGSSPVFTPEEQALLEQLAYGRFVYDDSVDEREELKFLHRRARFDESSLGLVIAPTMACNMACAYCFEGDKRGRMSEEVRQALIDFVRERAPRLESLDICWYGGEPLLAMDLIDELTASFRGLCAAHNLSYSASMISNGYLLSRETADRLAGLKINQLQVTLDGPSDIHNRKRPLKNGKE
ncbi:radical SAM protein, partial [candidate division GN15 bacterium]|nr:radical SAM protein [candidate division GN15 bacterium]